MTRNKIDIEAVEEHDDGSATYVVNCDNYTRGMLADEGLKLLLYCTAAKVGTSFVYDHLEDYIRLKNDGKVT